MPKRPISCATPPRTLAKGVIAPLEDVQRHRLVHGEHEITVLNLPRPVVV
jgi:hypothetical protein